MIEAKDVSCTFARNPFSKEGFMAVSPVSIQFIDGERYAIVGESGSGKTTLARMIASSVLRRGISMSMGCLFTVNTRFIQITSRKSKLFNRTLHLH